ncbi:hypothetical protein DH2020_044997 [Rehmannia glutinosa]|uniref:Helicase ATP-binding domain-containing protein n=1 Tax=Rehmannia glutinosa TaxID=99300 RepID=A0ABR0UFJ6_REHGL
MACSSPIIRVSSMYQNNPSLDLSNKPSWLHFSIARNPFKAFSSIVVRPKSSISFVPSAVATPNSSVLSEEAFKGLGGFRKGGLDVSESEYEDSEGEMEEIEDGDVDELDISRIRRGRLPKVLVLAPTRELAKQVEKEFKESAPYLNTICIYGGVSYVTQKSALSSSVDVVVGTPGRIIDLIKDNSLKLGEVQFLVLDETDQMLAVGFEEDVEVILEKLPSKRQIMLFSATMPGWVKKLSRKFMDNPMTIDLVGDQEEKLAEGIKLYALSTTTSSKELPEGPIISLLMSICIFEFALIMQLPALQDDGPPSDYYGRFSNTERRPQRSSRDNIRGFRTSRDWLDNDGGFRRGGRSGRTDNNWSRNSRSSGNDLANW